MNTGSTVPGLLRALMPWSPAFGPLFALSACGIYHTRAYEPNSITSIQTEDAAEASTNCFETSTSVERAVCVVPALARSNRAMTEALQQDLREADLFSRDALMASQRAWLVGAPAACRLTHDAVPPPPASAAPCLAALIQQRTAILTRWTRPRGAGDRRGAIAQYVRFRVSGGAGLAGGGICDAVAREANASLANKGSVDPASFAQASEIAGSHGASTGSWQGHHYDIDMHFANAYGSFARRARRLAVDGAPPVLNAVSLGELLQSTAENGGARFSAYASQTGDYGAIDVFAQDGHVLALLEDAWGFDTPAAPGEFAHAGVWDLPGGKAVPLCLFDTFKMPAEDGAFDHLPNFTPWRSLLTQIANSSSPTLGVATLRDQGQLQAEANWMLLSMPLVVTAEARRDGWTAWLRQRHDQVLDALFAWSARDPANKKIFDQVFSLLRPAAQDLVRAYQQTQALSGSEAQEAAGITIMELFYGSATGIDPGLGADLDAPASASGGKPRYPILASPS